MEDNYYSVKFTDRLKDYILDEAYSEIYGARTIKRFIQNNVETIIATKIIEGEIDTQHVYILDVNEHKELVLSKEQ